MADSDFGFELEFDQQAGADRRAIKAEVYAQRDFTLWAYLVLSLLSYTSRSVSLAVAVLVLNVFNLAICLRLKGT